MMLATKALVFINYIDLFSWDVKNYLKLNVIFNKDFPLVLFGTFLKKANIEKIHIEDNKEYKILGVRSYGYGAFVNRIVKGDTLKMREYQKAKYNHLFWCKVDTKNGAFGIIKDNIADGIASSNMTFAEIDTSKIDVDYLQFLFTSKGIMQYLDSFVTGTTNRKYIRPEQLLNEIKIPLPTLETQQKLVRAYNQKMNLARKLEAEAENLEQNIDSYLFKKLGIEINKLINEEKILHFIKYQNLNEWGVEFNLGTQNSTNILKSNIYQNNSLKSILDINPTTNLNIENIKEVSFLPMECISDIYGEIKNQYNGEPIRAKGYTKFKEGDLLWAKITPCMENGKSAIAKNLINGYGYGSTEFHVLRKKDENINIEYIYHLLRTKLLRLEAKSSFTGSAGQQRVGKVFLENLIIPLPSLSIQNQIVEYLTKQKDKIKQLKNQAQENRQQAKEEFETAIFF